MLVLEAAFPHGRYYAARSDVPEQPEWPPHPSRLFSALVAAAYVGKEDQDADELEALLWLEQQGPPDIKAPPADLKPIPVCYVPPGDLNAQRNKDEHPFYRIKKERHFPSAIILGTPQVRYAWKSIPPPALLSALDRLASQVTHIGTSHSVALVKAYYGELTEASYVPDESGQCYLRNPAAGRFNELIEMHSRVNPKVRRPLSPFEPLIAYRVYGKQQKALVRESPFPELMCLRIRNLTYYVDHAKLLTRAFRRAIMSRIPDPIPTVVHGHEDGPHVGWLPLSDVGHDNAKGRIIGLGLALPKNISASDRQTLLKALGEVLENGVRLDDGRDMALETTSSQTRPPRALQSGTWVRPSKVWATVSPVVPDRMPKRSKAQEIAESISNSLVMAGYPEPEKVEPSPLSAFQGVPSALAFPSKLARFHAVVTFPTEVQGPVVAGRLRYFGIGLFRPLPLEAGR